RDDREGVGIRWKRACGGGAIALAMGAVTLTAYRSEPAKAANAPAAPNRMVVATAAAHDQSLERTAEIQGALYPREHAILASNIDGAVVQVTADFGDSVKEGQVLMRID